MWVINNLEKFPGNELIVFNRWGDILYKAKPYNNDWEGTNQNGQPLPEGTYYYVLRLNINDGKVLKGDITILR
jgi:gliding motility-associated-like protein